MHINREGLKPSLAIYLWLVNTSSRFPTLTALVDPELVGLRLCGCGPVLQQRLVLLWGKENPQLVSKETWMLELETGNSEFRWRKVKQPCYIVMDLDKFDQVVKAIHCICDFLAQLV